VFSRRIPHAGIGYIGIRAKIQRLCIEEGAAVRGWTQDLESTGDSCLGVEIYGLDLVADVTVDPVIVLVTCGF
jgi:hypothetical protein